MPLESAPIEPLALTPGRLQVPAGPEDLARLCRELRRDIIELTWHSGTQSSHVGGELSAVEILAALFFHTLRLDPARPDWAERDRFVLSKGHASAAMYAAMAWRGFFPRTRLFDAFNRVDGLLQEHVNMKTPGAEIPTGSLGMGLSAGAGMAWGLGFDAARAGRRSPGVFVLMSDGECTAGQTWEAAMAAAQFGLENLVAVVDDNQRFVTGPSRRVMGLEPFDAKWQAFGWHVTALNGHDLPGLCAALEAARRPETAPGRPRILLCRTRKGRGVSFMEDSDQWHAGHLTQAQYAQALQEVSR